MRTLYEAPPRQRRPKGAETLSGGSVQVLGDSIYYWASGSGEEGPTVLFLHQSGGSSGTWHGQLTGLADYARCLVPDLPGHGQSEGAGCESIAEYRQVVIGFLDALAIKWPVTVVGVCLGAAVAVDVALHAPERIAGLVLTGVCEGGRASGTCLDAAAGGEAPEAFARALFGLHPSDRLIQQLLQRWRLTSPPVRHADLNAVHSYPLLRAIQELTCPMLLLAGEEDPVATPDLAYAVAGSLSGARAGVVKDGGCLSMLENARGFNIALREFLAEVAASGPIASSGRHVGGYWSH